MCIFCHLDFATVVELLCTVCLVIIYFKQARIMSKQKEIQQKQHKLQERTANIEVADKLQGLYNSYMRLHTTIIDMREGLFSPPLVTMWGSNAEMFDEYGKCSTEYEKQINRSTFWVSKTTLNELREYLMLSRDYFHKIQLLAMAIKSAYNSQEYDEAYRTYIESEGKLSVRAFMESLKTVDKFHAPYDDFADINGKVEHLSKTILEKFKEKEGFGEII